MITWVLACRDPAPPPTDLAPEHSAAPWTGGSGYPYDTIRYLSVEGAARTDGGELCVFAHDLLDYSWYSRRPRTGYGPRPFAGYWVPLDVTVEQPPTAPSLPDVGWFQQAEAGPDDTCFVAGYAREAYGSVLYAATRDGGFDDRFGRVDLDGLTVTSLARDGAGVWVGGFDDVGGWVRRFGRDGQPDETVGVVRLPAVPDVLRAVDDGFVLATTAPAALWRTDRDGRPVPGWGTDGRIAVPDDPRVSSVVVDLDRDGDALFVNRSYDDEEARAYQVLHPIGADGVVGAAVPLPDPVRDVRWDRGGQLWIAPDRITRRTADGAEDPTFGDGGAVVAPDTLRRVYVAPGRGGSAGLWSAGPLDWTTTDLAAP